MKFPPSLRYTKEHEWVKPEGNVCLIGVTDYAQNELGDIIYLDLSVSVGDSVKKGDSIGSIEAVKTVSEIFSPVTGKILELNTSINDNPSVVNTEPYEGGWIAKFEVESSDEINDLMEASAYKEMIGV